MSEDFLKDVKKLLASGKGDTKRLREILDHIKQENPVYMSDYKYVQSLTSEEPGKDVSEDSAVPSSVKMEDPLQLLRIRLAEGEITIDEFRELKKAISDF